MTSIDKNLGLIKPNQNGLVAQVPTPSKERYDFMIESQRFTEKIKQLDETVVGFCQDLIEVEAYGTTKTGKYVHDTYGAAHETSVDCAMGNGSMVVGRERAAETNYAAGFLDAVNEMQNLLRCAYVSGYITVNPPAFIPPEVPTPYNPPPIYYRPYGYYWY